MHKLSIVVRVFNSKNTLNQCLSAIKKFTYKNYELIVVDDGSTDNSINIASKFTKLIIKNSINLGMDRAMIEGVKKANGEILVNVDSDVVIFPDTLQKIVNYFDKNSKIDGVTGILSKKHPNKNFASQYKNLYMNYIFSRLPIKVNFFYGSIYAYKLKKSKIAIKNHASNSDDTEIGQEFVKNNLKISLLKGLEVIHLKKYSLFSLIKNDFAIPYEWAKIFWKYNGFKQLGKQGTGFAHASREQITSLFLAPLSLIFPILFIIWFFINLDFFRFMFKERGIIFGIKSVVYTFFDHVIMMTGVIWGSVNYLTVVHKSVQ